jgi:16S rRNA (guanine527-N7)-methyltransferase
MKNKTLNNNKDFLQQALLANGYDFPVEVVLQLEQYLDLMQRWNKIVNLTAITDFQEMVWLHILDSLSIKDYLHGNQIIDVGTGAGLPGIPLALALPEKNFVLLDSNSKKTRFLTQVVLELGLKNIEVIHARCEDFQPQNKFASIVSRAFSSIAVMLEKTQHLVEENGHFLAMKGMYPEQEIGSIPPGFVVLNTQQLKIKGLSAERHLIIIQRKK